MTRKTDKIFENELFSLCYVHPPHGHAGYWLYDERLGMNLAMRAKTEQAAFLEALTYYSDRLHDMDKAYWCLKGRVDSFVSQFTEEDEE